MPVLATIITAVCFFLLLCLALWSQYRAPKWSTLSLNLLGLALYVLLLHSLFGFPSLEELQSKGGEGNQFLVLALAMYACMLVGMAAEYLYHYFDGPSPVAKKFDIGTFLKPFLISPLVFVPLAASLQSANLDLSHFDAPRLMVFLVAFENGFLWRGYFSRKLSESAKGAEPAGAAASPGK